MPGTHVYKQGRRTKIGQGGGELFWPALPKRAKISPPLSDFFPPGHDFCPPLGILFQFFLFLSLGWPRLQGGNSPPPEKLSKGNFF